MSAEVWRVAQIVVGRGPGYGGSRGSGYLVAPGRVLTAAHVVAGRRAVRVRLDVGQDAELDVAAEDWWASPRGHERTDLAVLMIPEEATAGRQCSPARFGGIGECTAILGVQAFGFPRFKARAGAGPAGMFRDLEQAAGHAPVAANRRQGTLAVYLDAPPPAVPTPGGPSPWEGMSGASVWAGDRIVGVIAEHYPGEGTGRLTARRIDRAFEQLPEPDCGRLADLLGLGPTINGLPDVIPADRGQLAQSAYLAEVRESCPVVLADRDDELAEWAEFCAGGEMYGWWQAPPWAGKSALASWFVTHPPDGADVVSFFITGRWAGHADSDAFLIAMTEQLQAIVPAGRGSAAGARVGVWLSLLSSAATLAQEQGRRLVVVIDGLDEDQAGTSPPSGRPSIASLLPRRPPAGVRFIITSRPGPGLPDDVRRDHPLWDCTPRVLRASKVTQDMELAAMQELKVLLSGDQTAIHVAGYLAGSGGGLTRDDLSSLTGAAPHKLDQVLRGVSGRSLAIRASSDPRSLPAKPAVRSYLFAHETLRVIAEAQLGNVLIRYRQELHAWIGTYANAGWPDTTPAYAIRGYPALLKATGDGTRLRKLARDPGRHAFLLRVTGGDYAALTEISAALSSIVEQEIPDVRALVELAAFQHANSARNQFIPAELPAALATAGDPDHAEALAHTISNAYDQAQAVTALAIVLAQAGDPDRAEGLARSITSPKYEARALTRLVAALAQAGDHDRAHQIATDAEALARTIAEPLSQARALTDLTAALATAGDPDRADAVARTITSPDDQAQALTVLSAALAQAGDSDRARQVAADAEALAGTMINPLYQARVLTGLAAALAQAGDPDRAEAIARTITSPDDQARALTELAAALVQAGDPDRAEALARTITSPDDQARALTTVAAALAQAGDHNRARHVATDAEALARTITRADHQARALTTLAAAVAQAGDPDRAEALARTITSPDDQAKALTVLSAALAQAGDYNRAEALARTITGPDEQARALTAVAAALAQAGDRHRARQIATDAEALARTTTSPIYQAQAFRGLAAALAQAEDPDQAEALARTIANLYDRAQALTVLAAALAQAGDPDRAEALARTISPPTYQAQALTAVIAALAQAGYPDRAEALARTIDSPDGQVRALSMLSTVLAQARDYDRARQVASNAEALAHTIDSPDDQARALTVLAAVLAHAGDPDQAEALARTINNPFYQARALTAVAAALAQAGDSNRAEALAHTINISDDQARALTAVAAALARTGDHDRAEAAARTITSPYDQARALAVLAAALAHAGDQHRAGEIAVRGGLLARTISNPRYQAQALTAVAAALAQAGDHDRARQIATDAEALARTITNPGDQAQALAGLAAALAQAGDPDRAEALAHTITNPDDQAQALASLVTLVAEGGDRDRAARLAAQALVLGTPDTRWVQTVSYFLPSVIADSLDILAGAYTT